MRDENDDPIDEQMQRRIDLLERRPSAKEALTSVKQALAPEQAIVDDARCLGCGNLCAAPFCASCRHEGRDLQGAR